MPATIFMESGDGVLKTDVILKEKGWAGITEKDVTIKGQRYHELVTVPDGLEKPAEGTRYLIKTGVVTRLDAKNFTGEGLSALYPSGVGDDEMWIDVDLSRQTAVLYQGRTPRYATLVSTGSGGKKRSTPLGVFRVYQKHKTARMHGDEKPPEEDEDGEGEKPYRYDDVPWIQYIHKGIALHTAFWHDGFGMPRSHGCINLSPADAKYLFDRTLPNVPRGWHGVNASRGGFSAGTVVVIHT
jgi:lipoprotein-anchoring transpeptidase ErfK/SrfK